MEIVNTSFSIGQTVRHKLFNYRGVIADVDPSYRGSEEWYQQQTVTQPPKDAPWYRILVHKSEQETYVAERNLENDDSDAPIHHPLLHKFFQSFQDGCYRLHERN